MAPRIQGICIGKPKLVRHNGKEVETGIFKSRIEGRVRVSKTGIAGDGQADPGVHGGRDKAVYVYPFDHYPAWAAELGRDELDASQFGENLMVSGIDESNVGLGDRFRFGTVTAIVAQPRLPCYKLGIRLADDRFPARFLQSGRLGFYLRVEREGETGPGDAFACVEKAAHGITVASLWQLVFGNSKGEDSRGAASRCLDCLPHLDPGWRRRLRARANA